MTPDDYLEKLLDAIEENNYWDVEAYAQKVLDQIHKVKPQFQNELKNYLKNIIAEAQDNYKKEKDKQNLINEIMKPKK